MSGKYNGWKNWETWAVTLWAFNDEPAYCWLKDARVAAIGPCTSEDAKALITCLWPDGVPDFDGDATAYDAVDWNEVACAINEAFSEA
jgi:hypothetical protein